MIKKFTSKLYSDSIGTLQYEKLREHMEAVGNNHHGLGEVFSYPDLLVKSRCKYPAHV
jgi:hypothetical protein